MDMCLLDRNFQVLPKPASQRSVAVEAFGERLRCSNEDLNTRRDCSKKLALRTVQVHGSDQHHFVAIVFGRTVSHFAMFEREARAMGFTHAAIGAMVRSSYHADQQAHAAGVSGALA
jgi:lipoate synthase